MNDCAVTASDGIAADERDCRYNTHNVHVCKPS